MLALRRDGGPLVIFLAGRNWEVVDIDWPRRRVSVVAGQGGGRAGWLGGGRPATFAVCRAAESVVAGSEPGCKLSRRAAAQLNEIQERLSFVDSVIVPVVSDGDVTVRVWTFAGGLVNAALSQTFPGAAGRPDDFCVTIRPADAARVTNTLARLDRAAVRPSVPKRIAQELKFSECLPAELATEVVEARLSDREGVRATLARALRIVPDTG
jgi:ATP-dependent Lhr-like helicase